MKESSIVDILIENIKVDQRLLRELDEKIDLAREEKKGIVDRLKSYRKDISVLLKYADDGQKKKIESLGFDFKETERGLNSVASVALDLMVKAKGNQMTNGDLYEAYVKTLKNKSEACSYTDFNIKCRSLFNSQRLIRKKGSDTKNTKETTISLNQV